jgi:hypothetical protein
MATFGKHNYASPFGAIDPADLLSNYNGTYDYSGFSSREGSGTLGSLGSFGSESSSDLCGSYGLEFIPYPPVLLEPAGYEVLQGVSAIRWQPSTVADYCGDAVSFEVQFTRTLSQDSGWKTLASDIPSSVTSMLFDVSTIPFSDDAGIRIRAKDAKNLYSPYSVSLPFSIANHAPNAVTIVCPNPGDVFDNNIPVAWREPEVHDVDGQSVTYTVEITNNYSSNSGWVPAPNAESLPVGTNTININSFDFPEGSDYGIRVVAIDELGLGSEPAATGPFTVRHSGTIFIDTIPPKGTISINDGDPMATQKDVKLSLSAIDLATGVKEVRFRNENENCWSNFAPFSPERFWTISAGDGVKRVFVQFKDYGGNTSEVCDCEIVSRVLCDVGNVTSIEVFNGKLYVGFDKAGNLLEYRALVHTAGTFDDSDGERNTAITALAKMGNSLYVATYDTELGASLYLYGAVTNKLFVVTGRSEGLVSKILTMQAYNSTLYLGLEDGRILSYSGSGSSYATVNSSYSQPVTRLKTDGSVLYAAIVDLGGFLSTVDGTAWKENTL